MSRKRIGGFLVTGILLVLLAATIGYGRSAEGTIMGSAEPTAAEAAGQDPAEVRIIMARADAFGKLERPPVLFDHNRHTESLKEVGCQACHTITRNEKVTYEFLRWEDVPDRRSLINAYHEKCMECHGGNAQGSEKTRELGCGECHVKRAEYKTAKWYRATFDHVNHLPAMEQGCDTCHHVYDEAKGKLVYAKGEENACGNCHGNTDEGNKAALRKAGHTKCIGCHEKEYASSEKKLDPYACGNCHKPEEKPRLPEPGMLVARSFQERPVNLLISHPGAILPAVPFNHEKHDPKKECSKTCHQFHARTLVSIDPRFDRTGEACQECHKQAEVSLTTNATSADETYHNAESPHSCIGCHKKENKGPVTCKDCHKGGEIPAEPPAPVTAEMLEQGPDRYVIAQLSKKRLPVKFPHSQHAKMVGKCESCHHYGPEKEKPGCSTCHGVSSDMVKKSKIQLVSAYHRMCIGCHRGMGLGPVTCDTCHEERESIYEPGRQMQAAE